MTHPENRVGKYNTYMITMANAKVFSPAPRFWLIAVVAMMRQRRGGDVPGFDFTGSLAILNADSSAIPACLVW
jgi:hypothetical protein